MSLLPTFLTFLVILRAGMWLLSGPQGSSSQMPSWGSPPGQRAGHPAPCFPISGGNTIYTQRGVLALGSQHMPCTQRLLALAPCGRPGVPCGTHAASLVTQAWLQG